MTGRIDIHRPSVIITTDYQFVGFEGLPPDGDMMNNLQTVIEERIRIRAHMDSTGGTYSHHAHGGNCHVCGAGAIYTALFFHRPSNVYIRTGLDCARKLDDAVNGDEFRSNIARGMEARAGKRKAAALLATHGLERALTIANADDGQHYEERVIGEIVSRLIHYGDISEKQIAFVRSLISRIDNRAQILAQRAAEKEAAAPIPLADGRIEITGEILTIKEREFGSPAILVRHSTGWKLWGSLPSAISSAQRGDVVTFSAAIKASENDPKFGFFTRPTKAKVVAPATTQA